jgi:hypothetical protein
VLAQDPSVNAGGQAYPNAAGGVTDTDPPLIASWSDSAGANFAFGEGRPGDLRASAKIVNAPEQFHRSLGKAGWSDYIEKTNPLLGDNGTGTFTHRFVLSGVMRIKQDVGATAGVHVVGFGPAFQDAIAGYLSMGQSGSEAILFAVSGGQQPLNNIFAAEDGSMRIWAVASSPVAGYYTIRVRIPVEFTFTQFRYNPVPPGGSFYNSVTVELSAIAFKDSETDFSSTFVYAEQNPIVPDATDPGLPASGWTYAAVSNEIALPSPITVATATGTGDAAFMAGSGTIENLVAVDEAMLPELKPAGGEFPHGFFSFDVSGLESTAVVDLSAVMPQAIAPASQWWFHEPTGGWSTLPSAVTSGTGQVILVATDGAEEDLDATDGIVRLLGGPGLVALVFGDGFEG